MNASSGCLTNDTTAARFVNPDAPDGATQVKKVTVASHERRTEEIVVLGEDVAWRAMQSRSVKGGGQASATACFAGARDRRHAVVLLQGAATMDAGTVAGVL